MRAGFAEIDITPPLGTAKIGWLMEIIPTAVRDPLFARVAALECDGATIGFVALDTLSIRWTTTQQIRRGIEARTGVPGSHIMVSATHNHGGPAVCNLADVRRDDAYTATMVHKCVEAFAAAYAARQPAQLATGHTTEFQVGHIRRVLMRNGIVKTHGSFADPQALCLEGPSDPNLDVIALRSTGGRPLGVLVNYACHPTDHGGEKVFTAGWPGCLANDLKLRGWPCTLFLNGAGGDVCTGSPARGGVGLSMEEVGTVLANAVERALPANVAWKDGAVLRAAHTTVQLPYREPTQEQILGTVRGAQRFIDPAIYDRHMPALVERILSRRLQPAEVQALSIDDLALVSIPAEYFTCLGLRIKERTHPHRTLVVGWTNGMVGYVPSAAAMARGGYETTFAGSSRLAPEAGDMLADAAIALVKGQFTRTTDH